MASGVVRRRAGQHLLSGGPVRRPARRRVRPPGVIICDTGPWWPPRCLSLRLCSSSRWPKRRGSTGANPGSQRRQIVFDSLRPLQGVSAPAVPTRESRSEGVPGSHSGPFSIFGSQATSLDAGQARPNAVSRGSKRSCEWVARGAQVQSSRTGFGRSRYRVSAVPTRRPQASRLAPPWGLWNPAWPVYCQLSP